MNKLVNESLNSFLNERNDLQQLDTYIMYTGISMESWENTWKNKNLKDKETNLTTDLDFAMDYSYNFKTGKYEDLVVKIYNIPLDAFIGYRNKNYANDKDFKSIENLSINKKKIILDKYSLFIANLFPYKDQIVIELIKG